MKRTYRSELRNEQSRLTRQRIVRAARRLIEERGFSATTVAVVAAKAGVAPQTVFATFGSKAGLVRAMLGELEESSGEREFVSRVMAEPDPRRKLALFIEWLSAFVSSGASVLRAAYDARSDPDVAALIGAGDAARLAGCRQMGRMWEAAGALADGLSAEEAAQRLWLLTGIELRLHARETLGWSPAQYDGWLLDVAEGTLLRRL